MTSADSRPRVAAVVLAYGAEPTLLECIDALGRSTGVELEIIVVDNGCAPEPLAQAAAAPLVTVVGPPQNRGFAGGCNVGVQASDSEFVALINSDAFVAPDALAELVAVARRDDTGIASASLRLDASPELMNSVGNPVHFTGITWAGGFEEPADQHTSGQTITSATGAALVMRREFWDLLGGFDAEYFAYLEDTELSLRSWMADRPVRFVPSAVVRHRYEFSRNSQKLYLLERNRLLLLFTIYERRTLLLLVPMLLLVELMMLVHALLQGWGRAKVSSWWWLITHTRHIRSRRRTIQSLRRRSDAQMAELFVSRIEPTNMPVPAGMSILNVVLAGYWRLVQKLLRVRSAV